MKQNNLSSGYIGVSSFSIPFFTSNKIDDASSNSTNTNIVGDSKIINQSKQDIKYYTKEEVSKHCTRNDFWTIFRDKVYDLTTFWKQHPGGDIILEGAGKDITLLFDDIGHSLDAELILKKYYIGELKLK